MWKKLSACLLIVSAPAGASIPTGDIYGEWHVVSISSLSGDGGDASVTLAQGDDTNEIRVRWVQTGDVWVSMHINECRDHLDFDASYSVKTAQWLKMRSDKARDRLHSDFSAWLEQALLACDQNSFVRKFDLSGLDAAVSDFTERLQYFATAAPS